MNIITFYRISLVVKAFQKSSTNIKSFIGLAIFVVLISSIISSSPVTVNSQLLTSVQNNQIESSNNVTTLEPDPSMATGKFPYNTNLADIYERTQKSVVEIYSMFPNLGKAWKGTGFVLGKNIITNAHVVRNQAEIGIVDVTFSNGKSYDAKVLGTDTLIDLAVLALPEEANSELVPLSLGDSSTLKIGEQVVAIGSPGGFTSSMSTGIVSALGRLSSQVHVQAAKEKEIQLDSVISANPDMIQTDTAINHGNSGGPLMNMKGEVIGVNDLGLATLNYEGLNFAIPSNTVKKVIPSLISKGLFDHPWFGVGGMSVTSGIARELQMAEAYGFLVVMVAAGSPAEKAGIRGGDRTTIIKGQKVTLGGDVVVKIDDKRVRNVNDLLVYLLRNKIVGENLKLTIIRDGQIQQVEVLLEALPPHLKPR